MYKTKLFVTQTICYMLPDIGYISMVKGTL
jgi:hypothetical protein